MGGDTTRSPDRLVINFTVLGTGIRQQIKKRSSAIPGDIICINDCVGDSGGGLQILLNDLPEDKDSKYLISRHNCPRANISEGKWLSGWKEVHAMMDVSDGIESDIHRIMESSKVGAEIDLDRVPISDELKRTAEKYQWNAFETGVTGGEDYCLMFTVSEDRADKIMKEYEKEFKKPIYKIGRINNCRDELTFMFKRKVTGMIKHGWDHFK
jgi:thiamine-monophosphate kinase